MRCIVSSYGTVFMHHGKKSHATWQLHPQLYRGPLATADRCAAVRPQRARQRSAAPRSARLAHRWKGTFSTQGSNSWSSASFFSASNSAVLR